MTNDDEYNNNSSSSSNRKMQSTYHLVQALSDPIV